MQDINLIPEELREKKRNERQKEILLRVSIGLFVLSMLLSGGLFVYKYTVRRNISGVSSQISLEEDKLKELKKVEDEMFVLAGKASVVKNVLDSRLYYSKLLENLARILPSGVYLTDVSATSDTKVVVSGVTPSYIVLAQLITNVLEDSKADTSILSYPEITSVDLKEDVGRIDFTMNLFLKKGALKNAVKQN